MIAIPKPAAGDAISPTRHTIWRVEDIRISSSMTRRWSVTGWRSSSIIRPGCAAGAAEDGLDALDKARALRPDVILMDLKMPRMNGVQAMRAIAQENLSCRVIVLTTYDSDDWVLMACGPARPDICSRMSALTISPTPSGRRRGVNRGSIRDRPQGDGRVSPGHC